MNIEKVVLDLVTPLVEDKQALSVKQLESLEENEVLIMIYAKNDDIGRLIGKKGTMANSIRQVLQIASRIKDERINIKFEAI